MSVIVYKASCRNVADGKWTAKKCGTESPATAFSGCVWDHPLGDEKAVSMLFVDSGNDIQPVTGLTWIKSQWGNIPALFSIGEMKVGDFIMAHRAVFNLIMEEQQTRDLADAAALNLDDTVTLTTEGRKVVANVAE
jgi:hypothetical protein